MLCFFHSSKTKLLHISYDVPIACVQINSPSCHHCHHSKVDTVFRTLTTIYPQDFDPITIAVNSALSVSRGIPRLWPFFTGQLHFQVEMWSIWWVTGEEDLRLLILRIKAMYHMEPAQPSKQSPCWREIRGNGCRVHVVSGSVTGVNRGGLDVSALTFRLNLDMIYFPINSPALEATARIDLTCCTSFLLHIKEATTGVVKLITGR
jgi:hypothetical protein